jgi:thiol:disulfide interchange protein
MGAPPLSRRRSQFSMEDIVKRFKVAVASTAVIILASTAPCVAAGSKATDNPITADALSKKSHWLPTLAKGKTEARRLKRQLLVIAGASWCPDCRRMDQSILPAPEVESFLANNYVCVHVDSDGPSGKKLMAAQHTKVIPQVFVFASSGRLVNKAPAEHVNAQSFIDLVTDLSKTPQK